MEEALDAAGDPAEICQDCGSPDVEHRSLLLVDGEQEGRLVLLCDDCHRKRAGAQG